LFDEHFKAKNEVRTGEELPKSQFLQRRKDRGMKISKELLRQITKDAHRRGRLGHSLPEYSWHPDGWFWYPINMPDYLKEIDTAIDKKGRRDVDEEIGSRECQNGAEAIRRGQRND